MLLKRLRSKNFLFISLTIFLSLFSLSGCGVLEDDDDGDPDKKQRPLTISDLAGTYEMTEFTTTDTEEGKTRDQDSVETWTGRMVITSEGLMHVEWSVNEENYDFETDIIEVENDALQIKDGGDVGWVDLFLQDDLLTLIFPEDEWVQGITTTLGFRLISKSEYIPADIDTDTDTDTDTDYSVDLTLSDLVGNYELTGFSISDTNEGGTVDESDAQSWSGQVEITAQGYLNFTHVINGNESNYRWEIVTVENDALFLRVHFSSGPCEEWVDMRYSEETLDLVWPTGEECWQGFALTLHLRRIDAPSQNDDDTDADTDTDAEIETNPIIADLAGSYVQTGFTVIYTEDGRVIDDSDYEPGSWSGHLVITERGNFNYRQTINSNDNYYEWMIMDAEADALQLNDGTCTQHADMAYDENNLMVRLNPGECMTDTLIMHFTRTSEDFNLQSRFHLVGRSPNGSSSSCNDLSRRAGELLLDRHRP